MSGLMDETRLTERLQDLAGAVEVPVALPEDDLRRGRRRLRRRRGLGAAVGVVAAAAVVGASYGVLQGSPRATDAAPPVAAPGEEKQQAVPADAVRRATDLAAEPGSRRWERLSISIRDVRAVAAALESEAGEGRWVELGLGAGERWSAVVPATCPAGWTCADVDVPGATRGAVAERPGLTQVVAEFSGGVVVATLLEDGATADLAYDDGLVDDIHWSGGN